MKLMKINFPRFQLSGFSGFSFSPSLGQRSTANHVREASSISSTTCRMLIGSHQFRSAYSRRGRQPRYPPYMRAAQQDRALPSRRARAAAVRRRSAPSASASSAPAFSAPPAAAALFASAFGSARASQPTSARARGRRLRQESRNIGRRLREDPAALGNNPLKSLEPPLRERPAGAAAREFGAHQIDGQHPECQHRSQSGGSVNSGREPTSMGGRSRIPKAGASSVQKH
jgi:hypothetical protein